MEETLMLNSKIFEEDIPELYSSDDGEEGPNYERQEAYNRQSREMQKEVLTDAHTKLVAKYAFNSLSVTEKQAFDQKFANNKFVKFELNDIYRLIEQQQLDSYEQYLALE